MKSSLIWALTASFVFTACGDKPTPPTPANAAPAAVQPGYEATLVEGINFKRDGYPSFISQVSGMSGYEPWGRWSDADAGGPDVRFTFKNKLPSNFKLVITAQAFGPNDGQPVKVKVGSISQTFVIKNTAEPTTYTLTFDKVDSDVILFTPPSPTSPASVNKDTPDLRKLGIGFISLKFL